MPTVFVARMEPLSRGNWTHHDHRNRSYHNSSSISAGRGLLTVDKLAQQGSDQAPPNYAPLSKAAGSLIILIILLSVILLVGIIAGVVLEFLVRRRRARQNAAGEISLGDHGHQNRNLVSRPFSALSRYWRHGGVRRGLSPDPPLVRNVESSEGIGSTAIALRDLEVGLQPPRQPTPPSRTNSFPQFPFTRRGIWPERSAASSPVEMDKTWPEPKDLVIHDARAPEQIKVIALNRIRSHHAQIDTIHEEAPVANPFVIGDEEEDVEYEQTLHEIRHLDDRTGQDRRADEWHEISLD